jgi:hypothetical protein
VRAPGESSPDFRRELNITTGGEITMAGKIKQMIDTLVTLRAQDNELLAGIIRTKLILKGIDPNRFTAQSPDDPAVISKLEALLKQL